MCGEERSFGDSCSQQDVFLAQILSLPQVVAYKATNLAGAFLLSGCLERLAWQEFHRKREVRGLGISCSATRGRPFSPSSLHHAG
jgi:hypothetical protein